MRLTFSPIRCRWQRLVPLLLLPFVMCPLTRAASDPPDSINEVTGITVVAHRAGAHDPVTFSTLSGETIRARQTIGDPTLLISSQPGVYTFSDAGGSLGYTYTSIRGFDDRRIATYLNGVPLNDPEDQYSYWVDLPDFLSSVTDIQVQRGTGNAPFGDPAFGGSVNVVSTVFARPRETRIRLGQGLQTAAHGPEGHSMLGAVDFSSGIVDGTYAFHGRISRQSSDGYRTQSWAQGTGYFFSVGRLDPKMSTELLVFGGPENLHLTYLGIPRDQIALDRRANPFTYSGETDNFSQPHYQLHHRWDLGDDLSLANTLYYVRGRGYFEQFIAGGNYADYGLDSTLTGNISVGDLTRQQAVAKGQFGWTGRLTHATNGGSASLVGSLYLFHSDHSGEVIRAAHADDALTFPHRYYRWFGTKQVGSLGIELTRSLSPSFRLTAALHGRLQHYDLRQEKLALFRGYHFATNWFLLSPRLGGVLTIAEKNHERVDLYASVAIASRTPTDAALYDASDPSVTPSLAIGSRQVSGSDTVTTFGRPLFHPERVTSLEVGLRHSGETFSGSAAVYVMDFADEIIPYGGINSSTGQLATANANGSSRLGLELDGKWTPSQVFNFEGAFSWQRNRIRDFSDTLDVYDPAGTYLRSDDVHFSGREGVGFPAWLANLRAEAHHGQISGSIRLQAGGKQFMELGNLDSLAIRPFAVVGCDLGLTTGKIAGIGSTRLLFTVDNLFNRKFERSGYGWNTLTAADVGAPARLSGGAEYYVAAERSFFLLMELRFE